jgi:hypothetical protein
MSPPIYLNNSSLTDLACGRRYIYKIVRGAVTPSKEAFDIGTFFHHLMWIIQPQDNVATLVGIMRNIYAADPTKPRIPDNIWNLVPSDVTKVSLADLACQARDQIQLCQLPAWRELTLESPLRIHWTEDDHTGDVPYHHERVVTLIGTPDLIQYDPQARAVILTDYKTTGSPITDDKLNNYRISSQLFFYTLLARLNAAAFSPEAADALNSFRVKLRYVLVEYKTKRLHVEPPRDISTAAHGELLSIVQEKAQLAVFYHNNPQAARKDGMTFNHCMFCPFTGICAINNPAQEERLFSTWSLGFKPHNPKEREH